LHAAGDDLPIQVIPRHARFVARPHAALAGQPLEEAPNECGSFGSSRCSDSLGPGRKMATTSLRLLSSSATNVVPFSMTGLLSHVALFPTRNNPRHFAIGQAGPSILSKGLLFSGCCRSAARSERSAPAR